jgi:hypothetical protein
VLNKVTLPISQTELRERVFSGEILHFSRLPAVDKFCDIARQVCESTLEDLDPVNSHQTTNYSHWLKAIYQYQLAAQDEQQCKQAFSEALQNIGLNLDDTFCDRFIFRVVPPQSDQAEGAHSWVDTHRDTWGAGIYQQINWWAPLYSYEAGNGIEFYLDHFEQPIANTTAEWRYEQFSSARQTQLAELKPTFKPIPSVLEKPSGQIFRPLIKPGELLCFSAAHLHGSSTNATVHSRFSYETRTVNLRDIRSGEKARNVDNDSSAQLLKLFKNLSDGSPLTRAHFDLPF